MLCHICFSCLGVWSPLNNYAPNRQLHWRLVCFSFFPCFLSRFLTVSLYKWYNSLNFWYHFCSVVFSRTKEFCSFFHGLMRVCCHNLIISAFILLIMILGPQDPVLILHSIIQEKQIKKLYLALASAPVSTGIISHYMRPVNVAPRLVSEGYSSDLCLFLCSLFYSLQDLLSLFSLLNIYDIKPFRFTLCQR